MLLTLNNYMQRHKVLRIFFIMFLILCILFVGCMASMTSVYALNPALVGPALTVVSAILVAAGIQASSDADLSSLANSYYNSLPAVVTSGISKIVTDFSSWTNPATFTFKITDEISQSLSSWISNNYIDDEIKVNGDLTINGVGWGWCKIHTGTVSNALSPSSYSIPRTLPFIFYDDKNRKHEVTSSDVPGLVYFDGRLVHGLCVLYGNSFPIASLNGYYVNALPQGATNTNDVINIRLSSLDSSSVTSLPGATAKTDTAYFPSGVLEGAGATTYPSGTASKPLDTGTTVAIPSTGVNAGTDVGSVRVPGGTATGDSTGVIGFLEKILAALAGILENILSLPVAIYNALAGAFTSILESIKSLAGTITGAISGAFADIKTFIGKLFDTSEFKLDFSKFKFKLTEIFPFCIPFDFVKGIKTLVANSSGFVFNLKLNTPYFKFNHTVDLTPFKVPILFFRFIVDFWFCFILISRTRDWIKW
ncbi:MAG: hypothetical protein Q4E84_05055 [Clostridia bacterium]|nr:hypothetical protein [Clostridia bacterium]